MNKQLKAKNEHVTNYWLEFYINDGHCSLCGQVGWIDTRKVKTPMGISCGRINWCICPNGQALREAEGNDAHRLIIELENKGQTR